METESIDNADPLRLGGGIPAYNTKLNTLLKLSNHSFNLRQMGQFMRGEIACLLLDADRPELFVLSYPPPISQFD